MSLYIISVLSSISPSLATCLNQREVTPATSKAAIIELGLVFKSLQSLTEMLHLVEEDVLILLDIIKYIAS